MASSMSGMFSGQQPTVSHPAGAAGAPGPPGLLPVTTGNRGPNNSTLVDDLEASFEVVTKQVYLYIITWPKLLMLQRRQCPHPFGTTAN